MVWGMKGIEGEKEGERQGEQERGREAQMTETCQCHTKELVFFFFCHGGTESQSFNNFSLESNINRYNLFRKLLILIG